MSLKQIDPKSFTNLIAFAVAVGAVVALIGWGIISYENVQNFKDPVRQVIERDNLL